MENEEIKNEDIFPSKKSLWKIIILIVTVVIAVLVSLYLFNNFGLKSSKKIDSKSSNMCEGVNIVFFPGGNEKDSFASVVYNGAKAAEADLGANVEYVWSDWDSDKMVNQFVDVISESPDAIAIMGHPGSMVLGSLVDEAERKGIIVTAQNVDLPDIRSKYISNGFGYVGQSVYDSGLMVAKAVIRKYSPEAESEAIVFGVDSSVDSSRYQRTKGNIDGLKTGNLIVHEVTMSKDVQKDFKSILTQKMISDALVKYPNTKYIIADHGALTASMSLHLKALGKKPGDVMVAGFDLSPETVSGIKDGYLGLVLDQQPYLQGYLPILQSCLTKKYGFAGLYVDTGTGLIDSSNVDLVAELSAQKIR